MPVIQLCCSRTGVCVFLNVWNSDSFLSEMQNKEMVLSPSHLLHQGNEVLGGMGGR